ncbi:MAG: hypothetical protein RLY93_15455 [Sumerlaeia bacterium]
MQFIKLSKSQIINLDCVNRIEVYEDENASHTTIHFIDGRTYRCTEEEAEALVILINSHIIQSHEETGIGL